MNCCATIAVGNRSRPMREPITSTRLPPRIAWSRPWRSVSSRGSPAGLWKPERYLRIRRMDRGLQAPCISGPCVLAIALGTTLRASEDLEPHAIGRITPDRSLTVAVLNRRQAPPVDARCDATGDPSSDGAVNGDGLLSSSPSPSPSRTTTIHPTSDTGD